MMKRTLALLVLAALAATSPAEAATKQRRSPQPSGYCAVAERCATFMIDAESGTALTSSEADKRVYPASLTKLMTAYLLFDAIAQGKISMTDRVTVSAHAASQAPMKMGFRVGQSVTIEDALEAVTVKSANDAAVVLAEAVAGTETNFARRMTQKAHELGMNRSNFRNASGLPDTAQVTTARDMVTLARHLLNDFPRYRRYFGLDQASVAGGIIMGHNRLVQRGEVDGGKTGYINASGYNLVAWDERGGRLVIAAVFGGRTAQARDQKMLQILQATPQYLLAAGLTTGAPPGLNKPVETARVLPNRKPDSIGNMIASTTNSETTSTQIAALTAPELASDSEVRQLPVTMAALTAPTFTSSWAIQVGAYRDDTQAQQALLAATRAAPGLLGAAFPRTLTADTNLGKLYRAQLIGLDEQQAKNACQILSRRGMQCLPVQPSGEPS